MAQRLSNWVLPLNSQFYLSFNGRTFPPLSRAPFGTLHAFETLDQFADPKASGAPLNGAKKIRRDFFKPGDQDELVLEPQKRLNRTSTIFRDLSDVLAIGSLKRYYLARQYCHHS